MNNQLSIYLDAMRVTAALLVFVAHLSSSMGGWLWQLGGLAHEAVVFFFVLSGYVISYVTSDKENDPIQYALNRAARIYSVALPALLLTITLYYLGSHINPEAFADLNQRLINPVVTTLSALFFVNQSWAGITIFSNMPYWSLGYEVLYYVLFGVILFAKGRNKIPLILIVLMVMGPSIALYFPIWLLGVVCHKASCHIKTQTNLAGLLFWLSAAAIGVLCIGSTQILINGYAHTFFGERFISILNEPAENFGADYWLAVAIAINIFCFSKLGDNFVVFSESVSRIIKMAASYTFSIYLYHMPILFFVTAVAPYEESPIANILLCVIATPLIIILLGSVTEKKKYSFKKFIYTSSRFIFSKRAPR